MASARIANGIGRVVGQVVVTLALAGTLTVGIASAAPLTVQPPSQPTGVCGVMLCSTVEDLAPYALSQTPTPQRAECDAMVCETPEDSASSTALVLVERPEPVARCSVSICAKSEDLASGAELAAVQPVESQITECDVMICEQLSDLQPPTELAVAPGSPRIMLAAQPASAPTHV